MTAALRLAFALAISALAASPRAELRLAPLFSDDMVLQAGMPVPVWGVAAPSRRVTVSFQGQTRTAAADSRGRWRVTLDPLAAGGPYEMTVAGGATAQLHNVLVGEVWLFSGQSNMQWSVAQSSGGRREIARAADPDLRFSARGGDGWHPSNPQTVRDFSAIAYYFGQKLRRDLKTPIGLIVRAEGGTATIEWIPTGAVGAPRAARLHELWQRALQANPSAGPGHDPDLAKRRWGLRFAQFVEPTIPYAVRGFIWYQGESGSGVPGVKLDTALSLLVTAWRAAWGRGDLPFYFVQLPTGGAWNDEGGLRKPPERYPDGQWGLHSRERFSQTLALPQTDMAPTFDLENATHPMRKQVFSDRLARLALAHAYGRAVATSGPVYESMDVEGSRIRLHFARGGGGLAAHGGRLQGFAIAGRDGRFVWADATIDGDAIVVSSPRVAQPAAVRYGWTYAPRWCNLYSEDGFPALPFRTDHEPPPAQWAAFVPGRPR